MAANFLSADLGLKRIHEHLLFSTTINSFFAAPSSGSPVGLTWGVDDNLYSAIYSTSVYSQHDGFSTTILDSFDAGVTVGNRLRGISIDQDGNMIAAIRASISELYRYVGFTSTLDLNIAAPGSEPHGATWDGTDLYIGDPTAGSEGVAKLYHMDEFTTSILDSFEISGATNSRYDITYDGTNIYTSDITVDDLIQHTGFSSTPLTTINSPNTLPYGLGYQDADERMSAIAVSFIPPILNYY
jgi:hypothetical protein